MHLLRCLVFVEAQIGCQLWGVYIDTHSNHLADDLSRDNLFSFLSNMSAADSQPTPTCPQLLSLFLNPQADWVSEQWRHQFSAIFSKGLAPSTLRTYNMAMNQFYTFCTKFNVVSPFPVSEHLMCCFAAFWADEGLAPQMGKGYLAAVRSMQISLGLPDLRDQSSLPMLKRVQAGIQQARALSRSSSWTRLPITAAVLGRIGAQLESSSHPQKELMWAVACTAFFVFFHLEELLPESATVDQSSPVIVWSDVTVDSRESPAMVRIHLRRSK